MVERFIVDGLTANQNDYGPWVRVGDYEALSTAYDTLKSRLDLLETRERNGMAQVAELEDSLADTESKLDKLSRTHELTLAALANREARIANQSETIDQLNEAVDLWMDRAGRAAP